MGARVRRASVLVALVAGLAVGGRPLAVDDADPVAPGMLEVEAGAAYEEGSSYDHWDFPAGVSCGLLAGVELGLGYGGQTGKSVGEEDASGRQSTTRESDCTDLLLATKWQFAGGADGRPRMALMPAVKVPTADPDKGMGSGETDYDLTWVISHAVGGQLGWHANLGYTWIGDAAEEDFCDLLHYGLAFDFLLCDALQAVGEAFVEDEAGGDADALMLTALGLRWNPADRLTVDLAGGTVLSGDGPDFTVTAGLTIVFGETAE
jgi:hypothetical protein